MKALVTLATGTHREYLDIALPSFRVFAKRHGYKILQPELVCSRPVSWWKVPALAAALDAGYEQVLWVDADVVIVDPSDDLDAPEDAWQALVEHHTGDGFVPNCGVWMVRPPMRAWLDRLWGMAHHTHSGWWEQSAMLELLGYSPLRPTFHATDTELYERTHFLDNGWNTHKWDTPQPARPRFQHATMWPDRAAKMREWAALSARGHRVTAR